MDEQKQDFMDKPDWETTKNIHIDQNPYVSYDEHRAVPVDAGFDSMFDHDQAWCEEYNTTGNWHDGALKTQALLNLIDNRVEDGGFICIPGFHKYLPEFYRRTRSTLGKKYSKPTSWLKFNPGQHPIVGKGQRIPVRAGSLLVWNNKMFHGSAPNTSSRMRMTQYLKMFPAQPLDPRRAKFLRQQVHRTGCEVSELGQKLFGLQDWERPVDWVAHIHQHRFKMLNHVQRRELRAERKAQACAVPGPVQARAQPVNLREVMTQEEEIDRAKQPKGRGGWGGRREGRK
jgi:ectoine hydroxylase-related dioxygenase (phytanoyl-CoA dioxygenase family)